MIALSPRSKSRSRIEKPHERKRKRKLNVAQVPRCTK